MKKYYNWVLALMCIIIYACQENPNLTTLEDVESINYSFKIIDNLEFNFQQKSESILKTIPYTNKLTLSNLSDIKIDTIDFGIYAFSKKDTFSFQNLSFINNKSLSDIEVNNSSDTISLSENNLLFTEDNILISIENLNNEKHTLSGSYKGEINIYNIVMATDTTRVFSKSFYSRGTIDYKGDFYFFIEDKGEIDFSFLNGKFNTSNRITGNIKNNVNAEFASLQSGILNDSVAKRVNYNDISLTGNSLKGDFIYTTNNEQHILEFNQTKQN